MKQLSANFSDYITVKLAAFSVRCRGRYTAELELRSEAKGLALPSQRLSPLQAEGAGEAS